MALMASESIATSTTTVLIDHASNVEQLVPMRHRISAGSREDLVAAVAAMTGVPSTHLQFLVNEEWLDVETFLGVPRGIREARVLRCIIVNPNDSTNQQVAFLPWRKYGHITFGTGADTDLIVGESQYHIQLGMGPKVDVAAPHGATGRTLWDGAIILAAYLLSHPELVVGRRVIELGAGQGLVGVCAAILGALEVKITDLDYALPGTRETILLNREAIGEGTLVTAEALDWFNPPRVSNCEVVLAADVVWLTELVGALVNTLSALCPPGSGRVVLLSYQRRGLHADEEFWRRLKEAHFEVDGPLIFDTSGVLPGSQVSEKDGLGVGGELGLYSMRRLE